MANIVLAENCRKIDVVSSLDLKTMLGDKMKDGYMDTRHDIFSINNTMDLQMYYNYLETIKELSQLSRFGKYKYLLDLGYLPILMTPVYMMDKWYEDVTEGLNSRNIPFKKLSASSLTKDMYTSDYPDVWVSKLDCVGLVSKPVTAIRSKDVLEAIL